MQEKDFLCSENNAGSQQFLFTERNAEVHILFKRVSKPFARVQRT